jgi:hypothetical protein
MSENRRQSDRYIEKMESSKTRTTALSFHITGLSPAPFAPLFDLDDATLHSQGRLRVTAGQGGFPCRVSLRDAAPGDELLLLNYEHQSARSPYRASHAIYVGRGAQVAVLKNDEIAPILVTRLLSVRAFDGAGLMVDAEVVDGQRCADLFNNMLANPAVAYLHAHTARRGCYLARIDRVTTIA